MASARPSCPLTRWAGLQGFHLLRLPTWSKSPVPAILSWACALLQSASSLELPRRHHTLPGTIGRHGSSHEVCSPSAFPRSQQQHDGRACLTRPLASSGFLDLSTRFISAASLPALFHAGSAHGVAPFRALLPPRGRTPSPAPIPSWCWSHSTPSRRPAPAHTREGRNLLASEQPPFFLPRPKPWPAETAAAHLAGAEAPTSRTVARPSGAEAPSCRTVAQLSGTEIPSSRTVARARLRRNATEPCVHPIRRSHRPKSTAPSDETLCPLRVDPKTAAHWTSARSSWTRRSPLTGPFARLFETREPRAVRAIPPAPRCGRSRIGTTKAAARSGGNRSSSRAERASRSADARRRRCHGRPRLPRSDPKAEPFPACAPTCLTSNRRSGETCRRSPLGDRSPFESSRGPKSLRIELLRSAFREPKLLSNRTSGRDGPESFLTFRGLIPAAIRHSRVGCLGRRVARSSPGLAALQGVLPLCGWRGSHRTFPSWAFHHRTRTACDATLQGVARIEIGSSLSRPPTLMGFVAS